MNFISSAIRLLAAIWILHGTPNGCEEIHDPFELRRNCSNLWMKNVTTLYKKWHDDCEVSTNIKITENATMEHIIPVYECILPNLSVYILSTEMPIFEAIKMNVANDIGGEDDWRNGVIDDIFSHCLTKDKMSEMQFMSTEEFIEHNQCYWRVIDERCHHDTHQKI